MNLLLSTKLSKLYRFSAFHYRRERRRLGWHTSPQLYYFVDEANWSIKWDGSYITSGISNQFGWQAQTTTSTEWLAGHVIHYGSLGLFLAHMRSSANRDNTIVMTIFHGDRNPEYPQSASQIETMLENVGLAARVVTACGIMENRLIVWGVNQDKVVRVPLGVDCEMFKPASVRERLEMRRAKGIPEEAFCIGSFQKDGNGWGEGLTPKLIKGPDIFLRVIERLAKQYPLFVLLSGPARGYVKKGLEKLGVPYRHEYLSDYREIPSLYHCLDAYLVASREEGGPKGVLESLASGVALISTRVGMAPDVVQDGRNGFLAEIGDVDQLAEKSSLLIENKELRRRFAVAGLETIPAYDWAKIARDYYLKVYQPLINHSV